MGVTPANKKTFPAVGQKLCFVKPEQALAVAEAVVKVQRDFGNRSNRKVARLKYLVRGAHPVGLQQYLRLLQL